MRRIDAAASRVNRDPLDVRLIAVTKGVSAARVDEAISAGVEDVGENRIQEAADKQQRGAAPCPLAPDRPPPDQ